MANLRINSKEFNNAVTAALDCTYSRSLQYDNEDTHRLTPGCEELLYFQDNQKSNIVYDKFSSRMPTPLSANEKDMINDFINNCSVTILEDAKVYLIQTPGMSKKVPFVALPDYNERVRDIKKAIDIAIENPLKYSKFLEKIHKNEMLYYDAVQICNSEIVTMIGSDDPSKIAQTLKDRTSMTDTKRHLIEDIGAFGLDKFNKAMGTDFHSEGAAAVALMGGGAVAAEAFQLLRGQKGPIRTTVGAAKNGVVKAAESVGLIKSNPDNLGNSNNSSNGKQSDSPINQNDSTHDGTSSKNSNTTAIEKKISKESQVQSIVDIDKIFDQYYNIYS